MDKNDVNVAVVTGAGSGIGYMIAKQLIARGWAVWDLSRHDSAPDKASHISCDVSNETNVFDAIEIVLKQYGHIDALVCNAGFGISGALEDTPLNEARRQLDVNLYGADNVVRAVLPHMREAGQGRIIFISSAAARFAIPFQGWYSASKAALNAYALALRNEVREYGIGVGVIMPGDTRTGFTDARRKLSVKDSSYGERANRAVRSMEADEKSGIAPIYVAEAVIKQIYSDHPAPLKTVGFKYRAFMFLARLLPERLINFVIGKMY